VNLSCSIISKNPEGEGRVLMFPEGAPVILEAKNPGKLGKIPGSRSFPSGKRSGRK